MTNPFPVASCKNCHAPVEANYCPECGQPVKTERLSFRRLMEDFVEELTNADRGFWHTLRNLTLRPGYATLEYLAGKRKPYTRPLQFYLIMLALYFAVTELLKIDLIVLGREIVTELNLPPSDAATEEANRRLLAVVSQNIKVLYSVLVLLMALALQIVYFRRGFNYVEMLALSLYLIGYKYIFDLVAILVLVSPLPVYSRLAVIGISSLASNVYQIWGIAQFSGSVSPGSVIKGILTLIIAGSFYTALSFLLTTVLKIQHLPLI